MDTLRPMAAPVSLSTPSPGTSVTEEDDLYVSPRTSPQPSSVGPPVTSKLVTSDHLTNAHDSVYSPGGLSDYYTWSAALAASPVEPPAQPARKASESSNTSSKRSLPPTPGIVSADAAHAGTSSDASSQNVITPTGASRKNSLQPTLSQRYQELKERSAASAARRASQSSDGHTFTTSWERRGSERTDSSGHGYGRLPQLDDVQQQQQPPHQQQRVVSSPELMRQQAQPSPPASYHTSNAFAAYDLRQQPLPAVPGDMSPRSPNRRDSLPPIPGTSPTRLPPGALPPIPSDRVASNPASPTKGSPPGNPQVNGEPTDFVPFAAAYGGVVGASETPAPASVNRRNTLPPLPRSPEQERTETEQSAAQLYAQQQMAQQRREREQRDRDHAGRQQDVSRNPIYENEKDVLPIADSAPAPAPAPVYQAPAGPPPVSFAVPQSQPQLPPGQPQSPVRRSTVAHGPVSYPPQQHALSSESHSTLRSQRTIGNTLQRNGVASSQGSTPQRTRPIHPEFQYGDLTIQVSRPQEMDFLCSYTILTTASALMASTLAQFPAGKAPRVQISESIPEARLLLSALNHGNINHSSLAVVERDPLNVAEYLTLLRLYQKYQVSAFFTDLLRYQINARAIELSQGVMRREKPLVLDIFRLAVTAKSAKMWDMLNKYSQHWFEMLLPARLTAEDKERLGKTGLEVLVAWNALRLGVGDRPDGVRLGYEGDRIVMWRAKDSGKKFYPCA